ncbi:MAG: hypothetical protein WC679_01915 [Bacteroidales bacterium]
MSEVLDNMDDKTFLAEYNLNEKNIGPTINEYLGNKDDETDDTLLDEGSD